MNNTLTFKPRPSLGWLWLTLLGLIVLAAIVPPMVSVLGNGFGRALLVPFIIGIIIGGGALLLAALFPTIRYELRPATLALIYGPWTVYQIPYGEIKKMSWQDLSVSLLSSFRLPGFAMWKVAYNDAGTVKMCATAAASHILLIRAGKDQYGITPADEENFLSELMARVKA
jgi:hypothetical protein